MALQRQRLLQQRRTNLMILIAVFLALIAFVGITVSVSERRFGTNDEGGRLRGRGRRRTGRNWLPDAPQQFNENNVAKEATHLVMVACHGVTIAGNLEEADRDENVWFLLDYQKGRGLPQAIVAHIRAGIEILSKDPKALLLFSGGETRPIVGPAAEASAYYQVADAMNLWTEPLNALSLKDDDVDDQRRKAASTVRARAMSEEYARDSFENLSFSICRFREITGSYPEKITVVSFSFKQRRFETLHARALQWPESQFFYKPVDPPASTGFDLEESREGESKMAAVPFETDMYGCNSKILRDKRQERDPFFRQPPYTTTCPEIKGLLEWCGPELYPAKDLPWSSDP